MVGFQTIYDKGLAIYNKLWAWFKEGAKSFTMWYGTIIVALPDALQYLKDNFQDAASYIPHALQTPILKWIGLGILITRLRSIVFAKKP